MKGFIQRYKNAKKAVAQIRAGEWVPRYNQLSDKHLTAHRGGLELWIGNGAWFCEIKQGGDYFGLVWRHYVWWAAARRFTDSANRAARRASRVPVL